MSAVVLQFRRPNQTQDFSDVRSAIQRLAQQSVDEALQLAVSRHPKSYREASNEDKAIAGSELAMSMLEAAILEVRRATVVYLASKEISA